MSIIKTIWPDNHSPLNQQKLRQLSDKLLPEFKTLLAEEKIPLDQSHIEALVTLYIPLSAILVSKQKGSPLIVGINGSQGAGKSTLAKIISRILEQGFNKNVTSFSIDDLYKSQKQRKLLAKTVHPLLSTRGVPGTHDVDLGISIFKQLLNKKSTQCKIPVFDKSTDDCRPESQWKQINDNSEIILFEGWCVGSVAQSEAQLKSPVNELESHHDTDARWRSFVNKQLEGPYAELFSFIDILIMLEIPNFNNIYEWRKLQERKLQEQKLRNNTSTTKNALMTERELKQFIMHFERITRHTLEEMPSRCDILLQLDNSHGVRKVVIH